MKNKKSPVLIIASILMIILAAIRGISGVVLLIKGRKTFFATTTDPVLLTVLSIIILIISILLIISAIGILQLRKIYWIIGIIATLLFGINGAVNGYFIFGRVSAGGTIIYLIISLIIVGLLYAGRKPILFRKSGKN